MIHPDAEAAIERSEEYQPKRLRRADVAALRTLYANAMYTRSERWEGKATVWLPREKARRAAAKLGRPTPGVTVAAKWTTRHVVGLDVIITAHRTLGARSRNFKLKIIEHRFRGTTGETQFCREVAHAVRLGLGWCRWQEER